MPTPPSQESQGLRRSIGFWSGWALLAGTVIGAGIFRTPASVAMEVQAPLEILALWFFFGAVTMCGALAFAELATMLPQTGGTYVYLRAAYGDGAAFVFGWLYLLVSIPSGMAALAAFFGELVLTLTGAPPGAGSWGISLIAIAAIVLLSAANIAGVRWGSSVTNVLTVIKIGALAAFIMGAFASGKGDFSRWFAAPARGAPENLAGAAQSVIFPFNGWSYVCLVAGELGQPEKWLKRIVIAGTGTVVVLYLLANLAYLYLIPVAAMPGTVVAREGMLRIGGPAAAAVMTGCILASVLGSLNGVILTKARVAYALARDGLSFSILGRAHPKRATPYVSILIQGACAVILVLALREPLHPLRLFDRLAAYFVLTEWLALVFGVGAVFVLRRKRPDLPRPYRTPGYPFVPLFFIMGTVVGLGAIVWNSTSEGDFSPLAGLGIVAAGFPAYWMWKRAKSGAPPPAC